ncbi:MAG: DMT family transporter [Proteobacteria bacterium]|nr:DMT family transporter [Pseudomonadota bacterium]
MSATQVAILNRGVSPKLIGAAFMLLWAFSFSTAMAFAKTLSPDVNSLIILFMRYFFGLIFFSPFVMSAGIKGFITSRPLLHITRVICVGIAMACTYYAYRNLPLALATSIGMTGPLFTTVLSMLLLKDSISLPKWGLILFGYLGVIVMVRPDEMSVGVGVWVELLANLFAAFSIICVKLLSRTESTLTIMLYANTVTTFIAGILALSVWETPSSYDLMALGVIGGVGVFSQYCSVTALRYANPSYLAPFEYTRMCFAIPVGYLVFGEVPTFWIILGSFMIIGATYGLTRLELRTSPHP